MQKCRQGKYKDDVLQRVVENFLDAIAGSYDAIKTIRELDWVYSAIRCWDAFLRSKFDVCKLIPLPSIDEIPSLQKDEDIIEEREDVHKSGDKTLEYLAKNLEELYHHADQLMIEISAGQRRTQTEVYRSYIDLEEKIGYMGEQLKEHHYEIRSQHEKQTRKILDAFGKPYFGKETKTKTAFTGYAKLADAG